MYPALEKARVDLIVNAVVSSKCWKALVYGETCIIIERTVSRTASYGR
jgi:hypothetical protein